MIRERESLTISVSMFYVIKENNIELDGFCLLSFEWNCWMYSSLYHSKVNPQKQLTGQNILQPIIRSMWTRTFCGRICQHYSLEMHFPIYIRIESSYHIVKGTHDYDVKPILLLMVTWHGGIWAYMVCMGVWGWVDLGY